MPIMRYPFVIPGRTRQRANPESRSKQFPFIWIPGPPFGRPGMTVVVFMPAPTQPMSRRNPSDAGTAPACPARRSLARRRPAPPRALRLQAVASGADVGHLVAHVMDATIGVFIQKLRDRRTLAQRFQQ